MSDHSNTDKYEDGRDGFLNRVQTAGGISLSPAAFEQLYLGPKTEIHGKLRQTFGNPTPIALGGFVLVTTPLSIALMGWQGSGGFAGSANVGAYFWLGGLFLTLGGIGEWIIGNTFPATIFSLFGGFCFTLASTIMPEYNAYGSYSATTNPAEGLANPQFFATLAFFLVAMAVVSFVFAIAAIRTNLIFLLILTLLVPIFSLLSASFLAVSKAQAATATNTQTAAGALLFVVSILGWYIFLALLLLAVDFPICLPLGDLSGFIKGKSLREKGAEV